jgi:hypothetical protein
MSGGAKRRAGAVTPEPDPAVGFHAHLEGASLWDLVQMECFARSRLVVEVTGEGGVGYLYFDAGSVVHATTARNRGQAAALEILDWTHGTFQASDASWPSAPTIDMSHESLLLQAAKRRDEQTASNLVAFPERSVDDASEDVELIEINEDEEGPMRNPNSDDTPALPPALRGESQVDFPVMLRLSATGSVLRNRGGSEELAEATAYAHRLVQLTGELLGLEEFVALECVFANDRLLVFTEGEADVVALRPRSELNLQALRERLGL